MLRVAVRVASFPGLLSTTTIFGAREELPDSPEPGTVGLVMAEGTVVGENAVPPGLFRRSPAACASHAASPVGDHPVAAGMLRRRFWLRPAAGTSTPGSRTPRRVGGGRVRRNGHLDGQPRRHRPDQPSRHRDPGDAACCLTSARRGRPPPAGIVARHHQTQRWQFRAGERPRFVGRGSVSTRIQQTPVSAPAAVRRLPASALACGKPVVGSLLS